MTFKVLTGKAIATAISGYGKAVSTFTEKTHQLAYSALAHLDQHNDPIYVQSLYDATPVNYRGTIVNWSVAFGKVTFDSKTLKFAYAKGKTSDMDSALAISPAEYQRTAGKGKKSEKSLMERTESTFARIIKDDNASREDKAFARAMMNGLALYKRSLTQPKAAKAPKAEPKLVKAEKAAA